MFWIDHCGVTVSDLDRSVAFYGTLLDQQPLERVLWTGADAEYVADLLDTPGLELEAAFFQFPYSNSILEIIEYRGLDNAGRALGPTTVGATHIGFFVDDLDAGIARLHAAGGELLAPPTAIPYGPYEGGRTAYFADPDGANLQFMEVASRPGTLPVLKASKPVPPYVVVE